MVERFLGVAAAVLGLLLVKPAAAQESAREKPSAAVGQENFGFGASIGFYNPNGLVLRLGARPVALDVTGGFAPALLSYGTNANPKLKLIAPLEVTPQLLIHVVTFSREIRGGLRLGYRYNWALGHGGTLGGQVGNRWGHFLLEGLWGITIYPNAADKLRGDEVPAGTSFNFPPQFSYGLSVNFMYFP